MNLLHVILGVLLNPLDASRILGVFPSPGYSQYLLGSRLMKALAYKGHKVVVIAPFGLGETVQNYEEIVLSSAKDVYTGSNFFELDQTSPYYQTIDLYSSLGVKLTEATLKDSQVQHLLHSQAQFDLVIVELFVNEAHLAFAHHFKAPLVLLSTEISVQRTSRLLGNPYPWSVSPAAFTSHTDSMGFKQRLRNTMFATFEFLYRRWVSLLEQKQILRKYFPQAPELHQILDETALVLVNSNRGYAPPAPLLPNMIEIGGFHVEPQAGLPDELKEFLDGAQEGAILFSMGTNLNGSNVNKAMSQSILECFARLKQRVLWKWGEMGDVPDNVKIGKWFPQQGILAHPNLKVFVTHGGASSLIEAVYNGVPIIGIPIFGDQRMNVALAVQKGYGIKLPLKSLAGPAMCNTIREILTNSSYAQNAQLVSRVTKDQPMKPLDKAIYWVEYVIRNKGAPYLRSSALDLNWFQYYLLDVILCMIVIVCASVFMSVLMLKLLFAKKKRKRHVKSN